MRHSNLCMIALAACLTTPVAVPAQTRVAPPAGVESTPLAPPSGAAAPAQNAPSTQAQQGQPAQGQTSPAEPQPVQPPPTLPTPLPAPPAQQQTGTPNPNATLAGKPGDPSDVDEVTLTARPVLALSGQASWDQGFQRLSEGINLLRA
ncbi:MAG: hypothetical protein J0I67_08830, partial [Bosea sp.]|nr:hypothetical protein [Bosea sp. (in: a-proteobacteria)]